MEAMEWDPFAARLAKVGLVEQVGDGWVATARGLEVLAEYRRLEAEGHRAGSFIPHRVSTAEQVAMRPEGRRRLTEVAAA